MINIWNTFCEDISKNKTVKEMVFEKDVVKSFLQALGWSKYQRNLKEQLGLYKGKWRPDFVFYLEGNEDNKEIILELKKPDHKQRKADIEQIEAYMKLTDCRFGLYFGEKLEVFYLEDKDGKRSAVSVTNIDWHQDNISGVNLINLLYFEHYDRNKLEKFCLDHLYLNSYLRLWSTSRGQQHLYDAIVEYCQIPSSMAASLKSHLKFTIIDNPAEEHFEDFAASDAQSKPKKKKEVVAKAKREPKVWMISANTKYFNHSRCFEKLGYIYWKQYNNLQVGDTGYIYFSKPQQKIVYKYEIIACDVPYTKEYDAEKEFYKREEDFENAKKHNRYYIIKKIGESTSGKLTLDNMLQHGLKQAPLGAMELSSDNSKELLKYIEENF